MAIYSGFTHEKWWFSIAMLNYQRVYLHFSLDNNSQRPWRVRLLNAARLPGGAAATPKMGRCRFLGRCSGDSNKTGDLGIQAIHPINNDYSWNVFIYHHMIWSSSCDGFYIARFPQIGVGRSPSTASWRCEAPCCRGSVVCFLRYSNSKHHLGLPSGKLT